MEDKEIMQPNEAYSTFHSEEVQEIMGRQPAWILRWGITILIILLFGVIATCWFIKYPQTVNASITLTSSNPPSDLVAKYTGILDSVYVSNDEDVVRGQLIALVSNPASYEDVLRAERIVSVSIDDLLSSLSVDESVWKGLELGDIQSAWTNLVSVVTNYRDYLDIDQIGRKKRLLSDQILHAREYFSRLEAQRRALVEDLDHERITVGRDSILLSKKAISQAEYDNTLKIYISKKGSLAGFDATMASAQLSRLQLEQQCYELDTQRIEEVTELRRNISSAVSLVNNGIALWKEQYALAAPYDGRVSLQNVWSRGQHVTAGDIVASIAPKGGTEITGRLKVPSSGFGKVERGQVVNVKLNGFPFLEFGILKGEVKSISLVPEKTSDGLYYTVDVFFPDGLESTYHKELPFVQEMDGVAEIITKDMRLIERFIDPIRSLFENR